MSASYANVGAPFNFLGTFTESQWKAFQAWVAGNTASLPAVQTHHQIRAQQLRKTEGLLEQFYSTVNDESLAPTFQKTAWQPGTDGHWAFGQRDDHAPAVAVSQLKGKFLHRLQRQDDAIFHMNHLRAQIEKQEDMAQYTYDATVDVPALVAKITTYFTLPEYEASLVKDISDQYKGKPRFRVHPLDPPTPWEVAQHEHITP